MVDHGHYPEYWEADVVLRDGGTAHLRPVVPSDADALQAFHQGQSQDSIYLRFFTYKSKLTPKELKRFTEVDYHDRVAFVATMGRQIIGVGRYDRLDDPTEAEVAFNIADSHQHRGLGSILLEHLAAAARERGIRRFSAEVLPENRKMLTVFAEAGYEVQRHYDSGVVMLEFAIDPTERSRAVMEAREHRAEARSVAGLLAPASVAVIGAGRDGAGAGHRILRHVLDGGFHGAVAAVHPEAFELAGTICYANITEVPKPVELAVIAVGAEEVPAVVQDCAAAGVKGLLVATAGYDGERGAARQRELVRSARANGMRVIGPASLGIANTHPAVSLNASMAPALPRRGGLGLFSQSAALGMLLYAGASRRGLGLSSVVSAGNRADVSGNDVMQYWEDDPDTRAVGLYLESIGNPRKFSRIARRLSRSKPVIVAKSDLMGLQLPPGHLVRTTQAPAGALDAMLRQCGAIRVGTIEELMDVAQIVASQPLPRGQQLAVLGNAPALGRVVADAAATHRLTVSRLQADLDLDGGAAAALPVLRKALLAALESADVDAAVVTVLPVPGLTPAELAACLAECGAAAAKPVVAAFTGLLDPGAQTEGLAGGPAEGPDTRPAEDPAGEQAAPAGATAAERQPGVPCFASPGGAIRALAAVVDYARWSARDHGEFVQPAGLDIEAAALELDRLLDRVPGAGLSRLSAAEYDRLLGCYGISVLPSVPFTTADEAVAAADRLGWPVVLKTTDEHLRHRLDLGGVRLNILNADSLRRNISQMRTVLEPFGTFGLEVQSMAAAGQGCVLRAIEDPLLGPVISFGLAGDAVNLLEDWAHRIPPLTTVDVADLVRAPRAATKLFGYQGLPPVDVHALEDLIARLAVLKDEHPEIALIEFNPVLVATSGLAILSADVRIGNPARRTDSARRAMRD